MPRRTPQRAPPRHAPWPDREECCGPDGCSARACKGVMPLTPDAARRILEAVKGDRLEALFTVALALGLRQSETLGLRWSDVNVDAGTMSIQRTLQRVNRAFTFFPPKTTRSRRTIAMPSPVAAALHQYMKRQLEERMLLGKAGVGDTWGALVFTDQVGRPLTGFHVSRRFRKLLQLAGLPPMRYHDLRHGAASLMAAQGISPRVAMEILGHAQISTTMNIYIPTSLHSYRRKPRRGWRRRSGQKIPPGLVSRQVNGADNRPFQIQGPLAQSGRAADF